MLKPGDAFLLPKPNEDVSHLWIILTSADPENGRVIIVNFTTRRPHSDTTVIIHPREHPFVVRPTVVFYADARLVLLSDIEAAIQQGITRPHEPLAPALLKRVQEGLLRSPHTSGKIKTAFQKYCERGLV